MKDEENSSLELLLDTMCNTFGGVMFIAISLVVIISMTSAVKDQTDDTAAKSVEELQMQLERLRIELEEAGRQQEEMAKEDIALANDPRLRLLSEIAAMEATAEQRQTELEAVKATFEAAELQLKLAEQKTQQTQQALEKLRAEQQAIEDDTAEMARQLETLRMAQQASALQMAFTTIDTRSEMPYYLIVDDGKAWRIGPDDATDLTVPNDDVKAKLGNLPDGTVVVQCTVKSQSGTAIFQGDLLDSRMAGLIKAIPKDRLPLFMVTPENAETFYRLREILKQEGVMHGFKLCEDKDDFTYAVTHVQEQQKYEY